MADIAHTPAPLPLAESQTDEQDSVEDASEPTTIFDLTQRDPGDPVTLENTSTRDLREHQFAVAELISSRQRQSNSQRTTGMMADLRDWLQTEQIRLGAQKPETEFPAGELDLSPVDALAIVVSHVRTAENYESRNNPDQAEAHWAYAREIMNAIETQAPGELRYLDTKLDSDTVE